MTTPKIVAVAIAAAEAASGYRLVDSEATALFAYGRQRKWPAAETLARKYAEASGRGFPWPTLAAAPAPLLIAFETFRAMCTTLEPMFDRLAECPEPNPKASVGAISGTLLEETGSSSVDELRDMAQLGHALMNAIDVVTRPGELMEGWTPAESPHEIVLDLVDRLEQERTHSAFLASQIKGATAAGAESPPSVASGDTSPPLRGVADGSEAGEAAEPAAEAAPAEAKKKRK